MVNKLSIEKTYFDDYKSDAHILFHKYFLFPHCSVPMKLVLVMCSKEIQKLNFNFEKPTLLPYHNPIRPLYNCV